MTWGAQVDAEPVRDTLTTAQLADGQDVEDLDVASYLAKYATKATEAVGLLAHRLTAATIGAYADQATHAGRLIAAAWRLGRPSALDLRPSQATSRPTPGYASGRTCSASAVTS